MQLTLLDKVLTPTEIDETERWCLGQGLRYVIGVDEAGRGPLAGPVYAAAVVLDLQKLDDPWLRPINDSKKLDHQTREDVAADVRKNALAFAVAQATHEEIDEFNILQATFLAMRRAVTTLQQDFVEEIDRVFVDGKFTIPDLMLPQQALVKGDSRSLHIAAASILAKVGRDLEMETHHESWPEYGFDSHRGYPTQKHREAIIEHGPCPIHRRSFAGVLVGEKCDT